ncbi:dynamin family protein [Rivularia sp. IAM M-261]|nr:dynamin family protein [Rivularia sp. IAM M-261]
MDTLLVRPQAVDLLSRITGRQLKEQDLMPPVIFLASLVMVLLGVIFVDGTVTEEEKQRLLSTLYRFSAPESDARRLTHLMIKGIKENQLYRKSEDLLTLTASLTESQKLLLISFGYEMSLSDGEMDEREKKYLEVIAKRLGINSEYLTVIEGAFTHQEKFDPTTLEEVRFLLDPMRFQELDTVFVLAARDILIILPDKQEKSSQARNTLSYEGLRKYREPQNKLNNYCSQILQIIKDCNQNGFLPHTLISQVNDVCNQIESERFRVAVIGEFSQGKSTLLNALLGEEIQPAREIPCSGTVTVLRYGSQKRVICRYKDGREEEIPYTEYQERASISEDAAIGCLSSELAQSDIEEIIFEHPDLELCKSGVEIIDSPGLNEHPDRTAVTQKLLENTDAVIFLTNASRSLTQGERDLLQELRTKLNNGKDNEPAENLFVVGNFMDLIRNEKGREQVKKRIENFVQGDKPIVQGKNRVHFISAQATLDALRNGNESEYLCSFREFTQSLESFLTLERGKLKINRVVDEVNSLLKQCFHGLNQAQQTLEGKRQLSEAEKHKIIEQIGEASGREGKIRLLANNFMQHMMDQAIDSWNDWVEKLANKLSSKSVEWKSEYSAFWSKDKLAQDYARQFNQDLSNELDSWINQELKENVLKNPLEYLDNAIQLELETINSEFQDLNYFSESESRQWQFISQNQADLISKSASWGGFGAIAIGAMVPMFFIAGPIVGIIAGLGAGLLGGGGAADSIRDKVIELGLEQFNNSLDEILQNIDKMIVSVFTERVQTASKAIEKAISIYENLLEQQEKVHQSTLEEREIHKAWIFSKHQQLKQVSDTIEASFTTTS